MRFQYRAKRQMTRVLYIYICLSEFRFPLLNASKVSLFTYHFQKSPHSPLYTPIWIWTEQMSLFVVLFISGKNYFLKPINLFFTSISIFSIDKARFCCISIWQIKNKYKQFVYFLDCKKIRYANNFTNT